MFGLARGLCLQCLAARRVRPLRILLIGEATAGKTTLLEALARGGAPPRTGDGPRDRAFAARYMPTVGLNVGAAALGGAAFKLWDVGGAERMQRLWPKYYGDCDAVVFVVGVRDNAAAGEERDRTSQEDLARVRSLLGEVVEASELPPTVPVLVLVNFFTEDGSAGAEDLRENDAGGVRVVHVTPLAVGDCSSAEEEYLGHCDDERLDFAHVCRTVMPAGSGAHGHRRFVLARASNARSGVGVRAAFIDLAGAVALSSS
jgi:signal recognition particle receptor subunit beta